VQNTLKELGTINLLANCAGSFTALDPIWETDQRLW